MKPGWHWPYMGAARRREWLRRITPRAALVALAGGGLAVVYVCLERAAIEHAGVRPVALALIATSALCALTSRHWIVRVPHSRRIQQILFALLAAAAATGWSAFLLALPAVALLGLAELCRESLRAERSLAESAALLIEPRAPDWIGPYCRVLTGIWALFLALNAGAILILATFFQHLWPGYMRYGLSSAVLAGISFEYVFRKAWFRHYIPLSPLDRVLARWFPAEQTERGRRSKAYMDPLIAEYMEKDALLRANRERS